MIVTLAELPNSHDLKPPSADHLRKTATRFLGELHRVQNISDVQNLKLQGVSIAVNFVEVKIISSITGICDKRMFVAY